MARIGGEFSEGFILVLTQAESEAVVGVLEIGIGSIQLLMILFSFSERSGMAMRRTSFQDFERNGQSARRLSLRKVSKGEWMASLASPVWVASIFPLQSSRSSRMMQVTVSMSCTAWF